MAALSRLGPVLLANDTDVFEDASRDAGPWHGPSEESWLRRLLRGAALPTDATDVPRSAMNAVAGGDAATGQSAPARTTDAAIRPRLLAPRHGVVVPLPRASSGALGRRRGVARKAIARGSGSR